MATQIVRDGGFLKVTVNSSKPKYFCLQDIDVAIKGDYVYLMDGNPINYNDVTVPTDFESFLIRSPYKLLTGAWKNRGDKEENKMICSEFVSWVYQLEGWQNMTPKDVKTALDKNPIFRKLELFY